MRRSTDVRCTPRRAWRALAFLGLLFAPGASGTAARAAEAARPIPIELASGKVHVRVAVGEAEPVWFILDSGANMTILDLPLAEQLGLPLRGHMTGDQAAGGKTFRIAFTDVPSLRLGDVELPARTVAVIDRKTQGANGHPSSGLLGADVFRELVIDVDYPASTLTLHRPEAFEYEGPGIVLPARLDENGKWFLESRIELLDGHSLVASFVLDTGARGFLTLNRPFVEKHRLMDRLPTTGLATVGFGIGGEVRHHVSRFAAVTVGPVRFKAPPIDFPPAGASGGSARDDRDGLLGARFLEPFRAIFDTSRSRLILERKRDPAVLPSDTSGLFLRSVPPDFEAVEILGVTPGSPAAEAALERGDRVLTVDGRDAASTSLDELRELLMATEGRVVLRIERDGETFERTLTLRPLI